MSNELNNKLENLELILSKQQQKYKRSLRITIICYVILAIFVIAYTTFIMSEIRKLATPKTVAELMTMQVSGRLPELKGYITENADMYASLTADEVVNFARSLIPTLGIVVQEQLGIFSNQIKEEMANKYIPALNQYFEEHKDDVLDQIDKLSDEEVAKQLSEILVNTFNEQLDVVSINLDGSVNGLQNEINAITQKPDSELTKREYAEKKFLIYWMFIVKYGKVGNLPFGSSSL